MSRGAILIGVVASLTLGCAASEAKHLRSYDGHDRVSITCKRDQSNCYERANEECPFGFVILGDAGRQDVTLSNAGNKWTGPQYTMTNSYHGSLVVECKQGTPQQQQQYRQETIINEKRQEEHEAPTLGQELGL